MDPNTIANAVIATDACYLVVLDIESTINECEFDRKVWNEATASATQAGEEHNRLVYFNDYWIKKINEGECLTWCLVTDAIHKARFTVIQPHEDMSLWLDGPCGLLGTTKNPIVLNLPSGKIGFGNLSQLGTRNIKPVLTVPPGRYRVAMITDEASEYEHQCSLCCKTDSSLYPENDGPDWEFVFQRLD